MHYALYAPCKRQWLCKRIQLTHWCSTTVMHYCDAALLSAPSCITLCTGLNFHRIRLLWIEADKMIQMSHTEHILLQCFPCAVYSELLPARILLHWSTIHCITGCSLWGVFNCSFLYCGWNSFAVHLTDAPVVSNALEASWMHQWDAVFQASSWNLPHLAIFQVQNSHLTSASYF